MVKKKGIHVRVFPLKARGKLRFGHRFLVLAEFLRELLHASGGVDQFLRTGVKRVAVRTNFDADVADGRAGLERIAAGTRHGRHFVSRVNTLFHIYLLSICCFLYRLTGFKYSGFHRGVNIDFELCNCKKFIGLERLPAVLDFGMDLFFNVMLSGISLPAHETVIVYVQPAGSERCTGTAGLFCLQSADLLYSVASGFTGFPLPRHSRSR